MNPDKKNLLAAIDKNIGDLHRNIDLHRCLMALVLEQRMDARNLRLLLKLCPARSREFKLKEAIRDAIDILEESRKSFKSKRLEQLRKNLTKTLISAE